MRGATVNRLLFDISTRLRPHDVVIPEGRALTTRSLRRLGPSVATSAQLLLHEKLPLGDWQGDNLEAEDRKAAKGARMTTLYSDNDSKQEATVAVKTAVWGLIDRISGLATADEWSLLAPGLRKGMAAARLRGPSLPDPNADGEPASSTSSSSSDSSSSSSSSSSPDSDDSAPEQAPLPPELLSLASFGHGQGPKDCIHILKDDGSMPGCAKKVKVFDDGFGAGLEDMRSRQRPLCARCCRRLGLDPGALDL